jgi:hypothetical protein
MPVLKTRKRVISLRLSDDEYQQLVKLSVSAGAHSTSDVARAALCDFLARQKSGDRAGRIQQQRIEMLENEVRRINRLLEAIASTGKTQA